MESSSPTTPGIRNLRGKNLQVVSERTAASLPPDVAAREAALAAKESDLQTALATVSTAFRILGSRALVILTALGAAAAFGWALLYPEGWRLAAACLFTAMVFWPALWADRGK